jgi:Domain of unknown function (DUF4349)
MSSSDVDTTLAAIDAALAGEPVAREHELLAAVSTGLRELRPLARPEFTRSLDARAAVGFAPPRKPRGRRRRAAQARVAAAVRAHKLSSGLAAGAIAAALVALAVVLSSGTGGQHAVVADSAHKGPSGVPTAEASSASAPATAAEPERQIERASSLEVGVSPDAIQSGAQRVFTLVGAFKGYVQQSNVNSGGAYGSASFDIRVPSANLSPAIAALSHIGHVRSETDNTNDVTGQSDSLQGSLAEAQAERAGLLRSLAAGSESEAALKARLRAVDARIASLQGQLRALRQRVGYSSLALTLTAEAKSGAAGPGGLTPGGAARDAARILDAALAVLVLAAAAALPFAALAMLAWVAFAALRRRAREQALDSG